MSDWEGWINVDNVEECNIDSQIKIREELLLQMVGSLYPPILRGEIRKLEKRRGEFLSKKEMTL